MSDPLDILFILSKMSFLPSCIFFVVKTKLLSETRAIICFQPIEGRTFGGVDA